MLDDDAVAPKMKIQEAIEHIREEQQRIAMIEAQAQMMQQRASQFILGDPDEQSSMMADAMRQIQGGAQMPVQQEVPAEMMTE